MSARPGPKPGPAIPCNIEGCSRPEKTRTWCNTHYEYWRRTGKVGGPPKLTLWERFWPKVNADGVCWEWTAAKNHLGYGQIGLTDSRDRGMAHRVAWELLVGPIPEGLELDHLCRNHGCVNPDHLEPVTHAENMRRAPWSAVHHQRAKTHCPHGHEYTEANTYRNHRGRRECLTCKKARRRAA